MKLVKKDLAWTKNLWPFTTREWRTHPFPQDGQETGQVRPPIPNANLVALVQHVPQYTVSRSEHTISPDFQLEDKVIDKWSHFGLSRRRLCWLYSSSRAVHAEAVRWWWPHADSCAAPTRSGNTYYKGPTVSHVVYIAPLEAIVKECYRGEERVR
jgi:hypothetical protein